MTNITNNIYYLIVSSRPRQWLKNLAVFAALFFSGLLTSSSYFFQVTSVFIIFCLLSSSVYLFNDVIDYKSDRAHFSKKNRPIASGLLSKKLAIIAALTIALLGLFFSHQLSETVFVTSLIFILVQVFYSLVLKNIIILDIMAIALTFLLRVFVGSFVIHEPLSSWLILTVMMLALFLAIGKRRSEVTLLSHQEALEHRQILSHYPINLLDGLTFMMATASLLTYSIFTFNTPRAGTASFIESFLPSTLINLRWLMITIPLVVYGIFRYLYLIFDKKEGESPEKVLLTDLPLFSVVSIWVLVVFIVLYVFNN